MNQPEHAEYPIGGVASPRTVRRPGVSCEGQMAQSRRNGGAGGVVGHVSPLAAADRAGHPPRHTARTAGRGHRTPRVPCGPFRGRSHGGRRGCGRRPAAPARGPAGRPGGGGASRSRTVAEGAGRGRGGAVYRAVYGALQMAESTHLSRHFTTREGSPRPPAARPFEGPPEATSGSISGAANAADDDDRPWRPLRTSYARDNTLCRPEVRVAVVKARQDPPARSFRHCRSPVRRT